MLVLSSVKPLKWLLTASYGNGLLELSHDYSKHFAFTSTSGLQWPFTAAVLTMG